MKSQLLKLAFEVEIKQGEKFSIPDSILEGIGTGNWLITIQPKLSDGEQSHNAFLNSYVPEDEGLYDDC